jgi:electron transfer flavoprotein beta subunit
VERALKIAVCIKRVPDMEMRFSIGSDRKSLDQAGLKYEMGDFDGYALEVALQLVEKRGSGEVIAVSLGPDGVQEILRKALAMGATRAVQLKSEEVPFDGLAIAQALAGEVKDGDYDLILFGRMATDTSNAAVGPMTAELLGLPCVTSISQLEIAADHGTARRDLEGAAETVRFPLPAVLTIDEGIARPRLASLKGIMAAKKKPLEVRPAQLGPARLVVETMALPPARPPGRIIGEGADAVPELLRLLQTEAKVL